MVIDFDILTVVVGFTVYVGICLLIGQKYKKERVYYIFSTIMFCYFMCVAKITLFPIMIYSGMPSNIQESINYIPFLNGIGKTEIYDLFMAVPMGIGIPFVTKIRGIKGMALVGLAMGSTIEAIQYMQTFLTGGFTLRVIDINDVIFNFCGVIIGYFMLLTFSRIFMQYRKVQWSAIGNYIYGVCKSINKSGVR